jgi:hypothetical protein
MSDLILTIRLRLFHGRILNAPLSRGMTPWILAWLFYQRQVDVLRRYCREAWARAGDFATDAFASALKGIFPAKHSPINLLYCDNTLSPPPLSGPEPLSTARLEPFPKRMTRAGFPCGNESDSRIVLEGRPV